MAWDSSALFIGVKVVDDTHQLSCGSYFPGPSACRDGDSVEVVITDAARTTVIRTLVFSVWRDEHATHHLGGPSENPTEAAITRYDCLGNCMGTTIYEIMIPATCVGFDSLAAGAQLGVGLRINDGDTRAGQGGQKGWSGWGVPSTYPRGPYRSGECGLVNLV